MASEEPLGDGAGRRVRTARKLTGWTQDKLARQAAVSTSLVKAVEQGRVPASPSFVAATARALGLGPTDLLDQPAERDTPVENRLQALVPPLRRELAAFRLPPPEDALPVRPLEDLARDVGRASALRHEADLSSLGAELPSLLLELRATVNSSAGANRERAFGLLAEAYAAAGQVAYKLGYADLSSLTTDRVEWAAEQSGDELAVAPQRPTAPASSSTPPSGTPLAGSSRLLVVASSTAAERTTSPA